MLKQIACNNNYKRYCIEGDKGLCHRSRGKRLQNAYSEKYKLTIFGLYQAKYTGFGLTLAAEKLAEDDGIAANNETLNLWLKKAGLWTRKRSILFIVSVEKDVHGLVIWFKLMAQYMTGFNHGMISKWDISALVIDVTFFIWYHKNTCNLIFS